MKKKLVGLAVSAALVAPLVASADVSVYGRAHLSVDMLDNGTDSGLGVSSNSSRVGVKGSEDLGNGLKAMFQVENDIVLDAGGGSWATRNSFAGLQGGFGTLRVGQFDTPLKVVGRRVDLFGDQVGDARNLTRRPNLGSFASFDERFKNGIAYTSPNMGGMSAELHYSPGDDNDLATDTDRMSLAASYRSGPLFVAVAHETQNRIVDGAELTPNATRLAAYYDLGSLRLTGLFQSADNDTPANSGSTVVGLGARYKLGSGAVKAQYYMLDADADESGASLMAIGYEHNLSKATRMYANYAVVANDDNSALTPYSQARSNSPAGTAGENTSGMSVGIMHNF